MLVAVRIRWHLKRFWVGHGFSRAVSRLEAMEGMAESTTLFKIWTPSSKVF